MFAQVYIFALLAVFAQSALAATCSRTYTIVAGDYCDKISAAQNVSTYQLTALNPSIINQGCTNLMPGESICLGITGEDCSATYVVQPSDTCDNIAAQNSLNMTILMMNNPQLDTPCDIYVGEVLCVAPTVQVPAIPKGGIPVSMGGSTSTVYSPTAYPPTSTPAAVVPTTTPAPTPKPAAPATTPTPTPTPAAPAAINDEGDDNLPFCDEL